MEKCKSLCILRTGMCWFKWSNDLCFSTQEGFELLTPSLPESNHLLRDYSSRALCFCFLHEQPLVNFNSLILSLQKLWIRNDSFVVLCICVIISSPSAIFESLCRSCFYRLWTKQFFRIDSSWRRSPFVNWVLNCGLIFSEEKLKLLTRDSVTGANVRSSRKTVTIRGKRAFHMFHFYLKCLRTSL